MKYKPYSKYKDSGIEWLGKIPEEWKVEKLKYQIKKLPKSGLLASEGSDYGRYTFFTSSQDVSKFYDKPVYNLESLIFGTGGSFSLHYYKGKFSTSSDCLVLSNVVKNKIYFKYSYYFLLGCQKILNDLGFEGMGLKHLQPDFLFNLFICIPSKEEQIKIANYLDKKTEKINTAIEKNKKQIELLKEKRQAIISQAVTKGLNSKAKMKNSGIDWLGEISEEWKIRKLKHVTFINPETLKENTNRNYEIKYIDVGAVGGDGLLTQPKIMNFGDAPSRARRIIRNRDIIISTVRTYLKIICYFPVAESNLVGSTGFAVLRVGNNLHPKFLYYFMRSERFINAVMAYSVGVTYPAINPSTFANLSVCFPDKQKQAVIVDYLDKYVDWINKAIKKIELQNQRLKEFRQSLISNVVTGKIKIG